MSRNRRFTGAMARVVNGVTIAFGLYGLLYLANFFGMVGIFIYDTSHNAIILAFILLFAFLKIPATKGAPRDRVPWYDIVFIIISLTGTLYLAVVARTVIIEQWSSSVFQQILGTLTIIMLLEATRRAVSPWLTALGALFFIYPYFGDKMPGFMESPPVSLQRIVDTQYLYPSAIFGSTMSIVATVILGFIIFGSFLNVSGAGKAFIDIALAVAGRFRGGAAKVSVLGSCLFGMINGSAMANVATVGTITIPLMRSVGYRPIFAAAIESVASTGGPMTPPVMGAMVFLMMDFLGESYVRLMAVAAIPAGLYYLGLLVMVDHEAARNNLKGLPPDKIPSKKTAFINSWYCMLPLFVIVFMLVVLHYTPAISAVAAILTIVVASMFKKDSRMGFRKIGEALAGVSTGLPEVGTSVAVAGIFDGAFNLTGVGLTLSNELIAMSGGHLPILIIIVTVALLFLGTGLSGIAVYLMGAIFMIPALTTLGVVPLAAHFYVLWIAHAALITPPSANSAFLAAAIAGAPLMATGWQACRLGIVVYFMSVTWMIDPAMLIVGNPVHIVIVVISAIIGVYFMSSGVAGRLLKGTNWMERVLLIAGGGAMIFPLWQAQVGGLMCVVPAVISQAVKARVATTQLSSENRVTQ